MFSAGIEVKNWLKMGKPNVVSSFQGYEMVNLARNLSMKRETIQALLLTTVHPALYLSPLSYEASLLALKMITCI